VKCSKGRLSSVCAALALGMTHRTVLAHGMTHGAAPTLGMALGAALALGMTLGGCDGKIDAGAGNAPPVAEESLPSAVAKSLCEGLATCCQGIGQVVDVAACQVRMQSEINLSNETASTRYDSALGGQCIVDVRAAMASCYSLDDIASCEEMFVGTVALGGVCSGSRDCAPPANGKAACSYSSTSGVSTCTAAAPDLKAALGQSCSGTCTSDGGSAICSGIVSSVGNGPPAGAANCYVNDGLHCDSATWTCQPLVEAGGRCEDSSTCVTSAMCDYTVDQCVPKAAVGAACSYSAECVPNAYCAANTICQPKRSDGQACSMSDECSGYCLMADGASSGTCASGRERFVPTPTLCQNPNLG
jgi:hypothetical protein